MDFMLSPVKSFMFPRPYKVWNATREARLAVLSNSVADIRDQLAATCFNLYSPIMQPDDLEINSIYLSNSSDLLYLDES